MAEQLKLVQRNDFTADISTLNLLNFADGFETAEDGYKSQDAGEVNGPVWETISLMARAATPDALAAVLQALEAKREQARWYKDGSERYGVWLRSQLSTETGARQAFIEELQHRPKGSFYNRGANVSATLPEYIAAIKRIPYWEATSASTYTGTALNCIGGQANLTGTVPGDVPARLAQVQFAGVPGAGALWKFWLGFRTDRFGARASFQSVWNLRKAVTFGTYTTGGTTNPDAMAHDGYKVVCTFNPSGADTPMERRATIRVTDVTASPNEQRGRYTALMRAKLASGATGSFRVRLADGYYTTLGTGQSFAVRGRVAVTSTAWHYYELGEVRIPSPNELVGGTDFLSNYALGIDAERIGGAGSLEMDCLILIPVGEGFVYASTGANVGVEYSAGDTRPLCVHVRPTGKVDSVWMAGSMPVAVGQAKVNDGLPVGDVRAVLAAERYDGSVKGDTNTVIAYVYHRWNSLRGAE